LQATPVNYRHELAMLDADYREWRPEGKPRHSLHMVADVPVLTAESEGIGYLLGEVCDMGAPSMARFVSDRKLNELHVPGEASFRVLRNHLTEGLWRLSRNYEAAADSFRPRPHRDVRLLTPEDKAMVESACTDCRALGASRSTMRDFAYMACGLPVVCYGAFASGQLVGFCSANPICRGVAEISWIVVGEGHRRRGYASSLLTAQARDAFSRGDRIAYYAGSAAEDLNALLAGLGFREMEESFRFIPSSARDQWRATWGRPV